LVTSSKRSEATERTGIVARRLRAAREASGLSQKELGLKAGLDPSVASPRINQYERSKHVPNTAVLGQIGTVLQQPLAYFYALDDEMADLITAFHRATQRERKAILALLA
jgi:transcriptional regulator with XRE-family HTH domain